MRIRIQAKQGAELVQGPTKARPSAHPGGWRRLLPFGRQQPPAPSAQEELRRAVAAESQAVVVGRPRGWRRWLPRPRLTRTRVIVLGVLGLIFLIWALVLARSTTMYDSTVLITGQSGIGLPPPTEELDFGDIGPGLNMSRELILTNDGQFDTFVMIVSVGSIRDFLHIDDAFFVLDKGEEKRVRFEIISPDGAERKRYDGKVLVFRIPWGLPFASVGGGWLPW